LSLVAIRNLLIRGLSRTKHVDALVTQLSRTKIQLLFSDSPENTADIVGALQKKEEAKRHAFPRPLQMSDAVRKAMPFYQGRPRFAKYAVFSSFFLF
jgi:ERCC4-type nuclease